MLVYKAMWLPGITQEWVGEQLTRIKWWATRLSRSRVKGLRLDAGAAGAEEGAYTKLLQR